MPERVSEIVADIKATEGCEVHAQEEGRIVTTVEDTETRRASEIIMDMHQIPGVITITLTYHHFEPSGADAAASKTL
ncbi:MULTISPECIES: chaperone NapD [unclassified Shimia]|uniref:chaperone NapD n=1 Tax=unclassified Shimia TaxID=2630038 RepID=UPI001FFDFDD1|nr:MULTISPECIES: chaperone NapD [unclassified Shimia]